MGPRHGGRGELEAGQAAASDQESFNGATTRRPWRTWASSSGTRSAPCFNGATTRRPWRTDGRLVDGEGGGRLQWGHDTEAVENCSEDDIEAIGEDASMGPRHGGRGEPRSDL